MGSEILGVFFFALGALTLLALLTHESAVTAQRPNTNWVGPLGGLVAEGLTLVFGLSAYGTPALFVVAGRSCFSAHNAPWSATRLFGLATSVLSVALLLEVGMGQRPGLSFPAGGLLGVGLSRMLVPFVSSLGAFVLGTAALLTSAAIVVERTPSALYHAARMWFRFVWRDLRAELVAPAPHPVAKPVHRADKDTPVDRPHRASVPPVAGVVLSLPPVAARGTLPAPSTSGLPQEDPRWASATGVAHMLKRAQSVRPVAAASMTMTPRSFADESERDPTAPSLPRVYGIDDEPLVPVEVKTPPARRHKAPPPPPASEAPAPAREAHDLVIQERLDEPPNVDEDEGAVVEPTQQFALPPLRLLDYDAPAPKPIDKMRMEAEARKLERTFADFAIEGRVREIRPGPVVTTYEFVPAAGIKVSRISALSDDIAMAMEAVHVRIVAPIPGKGAVGIEIPNDQSEVVYLKEVLAHEVFRSEPDDKLLMALGKDIDGKTYIASLREMPHVLIAGTTGSGKSVSVNAMICSILYRATPDEVRFLMIDPKMLELSVYDGIPHLLLPPIIDSKKAANALQWAVGEMERRYLAMTALGVRDIRGFNAVIEAVRAGRDEHGRQAPLDVRGKPYGKIPYLVVVIDEYADLVAVAGKEVEVFVMRLAQKARAAGIHVMLATQRPSVDVITGIIKANFPVRMGFRLASVHDSKTIINRKGAEKLLGRGDMLVMPPGTSDVTRVHGAYISEKELRRVVDFLKGQRAPEYDHSIVDAPESDGESGGGGGEEGSEDAKWDEALAIVAKTRKCSTSWLQRQLGIGYNRAARIVEMMERRGIVGPAINAKGDRDIHLSV